MGAGGPLGLAGTRAFASKLRGEGMTTQTAAAVPAQRRRRGPRGGLRFSVSAARTGRLMILPAVILVIAVLGIPIGEAVYHSMTQWDGITSTWIGPAAYTQTFSDPTFWRVMENNALLLLRNPVRGPDPARASPFLLNEKVPGWRLFRTIYFLPTAISWVVIGMVAERFFARERLAQRHPLPALGLGFIQTDLLSNEHQALLARRP